MNEKDAQRLPDDLQDVVARLQTHKPEASPLELDRIKLRAMAQAERRPASRLGKGLIMRSKMVTMALVFGLVTTGGTAGVIAGGNGGGGKGDGHDGGKGEYCDGHHKGNKHCTNQTHQSHKGSQGSHAGSHGNGGGNHNSHGNGGGNHGSHGGWDH
jgi:hypothetical protein